MRRFCHIPILSPSIGLLNAFNKSNEAEAFKLQTAPNVTGSSMQKRSVYFKKYLVCFTKESHACVSVLLFRALCRAESFSLYLGQCLIATN